MPVNTDMKIKKKCPYCGSSKYLKYGSYLSNNIRKQVYLCKTCKKRFSIKSKRIPSWAYKAYIDYNIHNMTLNKLSSIYKKSIPTIKKYFNRIMEENKLKEIKRERKIKRIITINNNKNKEEKDNSNSKTKEMVEDINSINTTNNIMITNTINNTNNINYKQSINLVFDGTFLK